MSEDKPQTDPYRNPNPKVAWEGCSVLLDINDGDRLVFARLSGGAKLKIGNKNYSLRPLIGAPFGSLFQVENGAEGSYLNRIVAKGENNNQIEGDGWRKEESRDNRDIVDNNQAQSLTGEEIEAMRRQGANGDEIVEALIANSKTFEKKTQFSQEKYRLRKQKKYAPKLLLRRPFARSICEAYFKKYPARIGFLRVDMLSLLLSMANVTAHSDVLVVDMLGGIVTGAVAERLGGTGYVCNTYWGSSPYPVDIVRIFNFSNEVVKREPSSITLHEMLNVSQASLFLIVRSSLTDLCSPETANPEENNQREEVSNTKNKINETPSSDAVEEISLSPEDRVDIVSDSTSLASNISKAPKAGANAPKEAIQMWRENGFSSLIIAAPEQDAWSLAKDLLPLLSYSAPFAIYHQYLQPLATCMHNFQLGKMAINLQISEPWLREYQVLPSRTHPHMQMSAFGGYVLSGTRISGSG